MYRLAQSQSEHDSGPLLPRVRAPTLLLNGTADPVIRSWTVRALRQAIPHARVAEIAGAPHAVTDHSPRAVARHTLDFLAHLNV
jgi:pimeloyl-ACP methyl ester carboxylesterase